MVPSFPVFHQFGKFFVFADQNQHFLSHDNYLGFNLPVEAGKSYKLSFQIKDGSAELAK